MFWLIFGLFLLGQSQANHRAENRITGGLKAFPNQYPSIVSIRFFGIHICTGAILNQLYVLTSGDCLALYNSPILVGVMSVFAGTTSLSSGGDEYKISKFIIHQNYSMSTKANNIALVKLTSLIKYTDSVKVASLATRDIFTEFPTIVSWGAKEPGGDVTNDLLTVNVWVKPQIFCKIYWLDQLTDQNICTYSLLTQGVCDKDDGAILFGRLGDIIGVLSSFQGCQNLKPQLFTRISSYIDWLKQNAK